MQVLQFFCWCSSSSGTSQSLETWASLLCGLFIKRKKMRWLFINILDCLPWNDATVLSLLILVSDLFILLVCCVDVKIFSLIIQEDEHPEPSQNDTANDEINKKLLELQQQMEMYQGEQTASQEVGPYH